MNINGNIGECVLIKAVIERIEIVGPEDIIYGVRAVDGNGTMNYLRAKDIYFKEDYEGPERVFEEPIFSDPNKELEIRDENATDCDSSAIAGDPSGEFEPIPEEYNDSIIPDSASGLPVDDEWSRPAPKKRGRPRKATVEDLMKRANE